MREYMGKYFIKILRELGINGEDKVLHSFVDERYYEQTKTYEHIPLIVSKLTVREYIAIQMAQGFCANSSICLDGGDWAQRNASDAYELAEALIAESQKKPAEQARDIQTPNTDIKDCDFVKVRITQIDNKCEAGFNVGGHDFLWHFHRDGRSAESFGLEEGGEDNWQALFLRPPYEGIHIWDVCIWQDEETAEWKARMYPMDNGVTNTHIQRNLTIISGNIEE